MVVVQSYRANNVPQWIQQCMESVHDWAAYEDAEYLRLDDSEILDLLPEDFVKKVGNRWPMLCDLGRLAIAKKLLDQGHERVVWLDADVLVLDRKKMRLPTDLEHGYAFGKEVWIEESGKVRRGAHNAICVFDSENPFLEYYIHACERLIQQHTGEHLAPQLLGPKFLKLQAPLVGMQLLEQVAMASPAVVEEMKQAQLGRHWKTLLREYEQAPAAYNLCHSLLNEEEALKVVKALKGL